MGAVLPVGIILARIMQNVLITTMCTSVIAARLHIMVTFATKVSFVVEEKFFSLLVAAVALDC